MFEILQRIIMLQTAAIEIVQQAAAAAVDEEQLMAYWQLKTAAGVVAVNRMKYHIINYSSKHILYLCLYK